MQGLADGYFVLPYTIGNGLAPLLGTPLDRHRPPGVQGRRGRGPRPLPGLPGDQGHAARSTSSTASSARSCGTTAAWSARGPASRRRCRRSPRCTTSSARTSGCSATIGRSTSPSSGPAASTTSSSSASCMCRDALDREESCGGHFRAEHQTDEGEALRDDEHFSYVAAWECTGDEQPRDPAQGAARVRVRAPRPAELQVAMTMSQSPVPTPRQPTTRRRRRRPAADRPHPAGVAPGRPGRAGQLEDYPRGHHDRDVVPRDARHRQRAADQRRPTSPSPSTTTAVKASAARAR